MHEVQQNIEFRGDKVIPYDATFTIKCFWKKNNKRSTVKVYFGRPESTENYDIIQNNKSSKNAHTFPIVTGTKTLNYIKNLFATKGRWCVMNTKRRVSQGSYRFYNFWMLTTVINIFFDWKTSHIDKCIYVFLGCVKYFVFSSYYSFSYFVYIFWTRWIGHAYLNIRWPQVVQVLQVAWAKTQNQSTVHWNRSTWKTQTSEDKRLSDYDLIDPIVRVIGDDLHCLQLDRNLWRIYLKTLQSRNKRLRQGIEIRCFCFFLRYKSVFFGRNFSVSANA